MTASRFWHFVLACVTIGMTWAATAPAQAQLASGCSCPAGYAPYTSTTCSKGVLGRNLVTTPAICTSSRNGPAATVIDIGRIATTEQQVSFWGISQMLQQKRDRLQGQPSATPASAEVSGYASFDSDGNSVPAAQKNNPLSKLYNSTTPNASNPVYGAWVQGLGDWEHDDALNANDAPRMSRTYSAQGGIDRTWQNLFASDDAFAAGIVGSWTDAHVSYDNLPTTLRLSGPGIGTYLQYVKGGFSADLTTKFDFLQLDVDYAGIAPGGSVGVVNAGLSGNVQYKMTGSNNNFIEPTAGFSLTHSGFGSGAVDLGLEDAYTVRLQAGARVGTTWDLGRGVTVDTTLKALVYGDTIAQGTSVTTDPSLAAAISPTDEGLVRGEIDPEVCFNLPQDFSVTLSGQVRFGQALVGGSAAVNLRKQF